MEALRFEFQPAASGHDYSYLGRNGIGKCRGLLVNRFASGQGQYVLMSPINSKGGRSRCRIEIPADPSMLREVGNYFLNLARETETTLSLQGAERG